MASEIVPATTAAAAVVADDEQVEKTGNERAKAVEESGVICPSKETGKQENPKSHESAAGLASLSVPEDDAQHKHPVLKAAYTDKDQPEEQPAIEFKEEQEPREEQAEESAEKKAGEQSGMAGVPESSIELPDQVEEQLTSRPVSDKQNVASSEIGSLEAESAKSESVGDAMLLNQEQTRKDEEPNLQVLEVDNREQSAVTEQADEKRERAHQNESAGDEAAKGARTSSKNAEETVVSTNEEKTCKVERPYLSKQYVEICSKDEQKGPSEEASEALGEVYKQHEVKEVKAEDSGPAIVVTEELAQPGLDNEKDAISSVSAKDAPGKSEKDSKEEGLIGEKPAPIETFTDEKECEMPNEVAVAAVNKAVGEPRDPEQEMKMGMTAETFQGEPGKAQDFKKVAEADAHPLEPFSTKDPPIELAPAKVTQKQSNNIISKVKQSFIKAKKAIIGKSASSKTVSADAKDNIKVK